MDIAITAKLASLIDHTLLKPNGSETDHVRLCDEAKEWCFRTVCVFPQFVELCVSELNQSPTEVCTVIDFPSGLGDIERNVDDVCMVGRQGRLRRSTCCVLSATRGGYDAVTAVTDTLHCLP